MEREDKPQRNKCNNTGIWAENSDSDEDKVKPPKKKMRKERGATLSPTMAWLERYEANQSTYREKQARLQEEQIGVQQEQHKEKMTLLAVGEIPVYQRKQFASVY
jgi:hypothetical protein